MAEQDGQTYQVKSLVAPPEGLSPVPARRNIFDRLWSLIVPRTMSAARPTVPQPAAFPYGAVGLMNFYRSGTPNPTYLGYATGFFVKPDLLVTAAHNLIYSNADMVAIFPGWDTQLHRSGMLAALRWSQSTERDVSVIVTQPGAPVTVSLGGPASSDVALVGYAFDYPDGTKRMSMGTGPGQLQGHQLRYNLAAQQGDSGGPVFSADNQAIGVHTQLLPGPGGTMIGAGEAADAQLLSILATLENQARAD